MPLFLPIIKRVVLPVSFCALQENPSEDHQILTIKFPPKIPTFHFRILKELSSIWYISFFLTQNS